jgi:hypothetical protein
MIRNMVFHISVVLLIAGCGKDEEGIENRSPNGILIEVEVPQTNGWSTEEVTGTRSGMAKTVRQKGEYGVDMEVSTLHCPAGTVTEEASTRWANVDDNITFRVVAYKSATAAGISTANYAGYGDYKLSGSSVQTTKSLILPVGTYTFIVYSYGNSSAITAFTNSSASVPVTNGQNFMTYVKAGVAINNIGSTYTLGNIVFKHHCARYRVQAIAQAGRMGAITACAGTVTLPRHNATYSFTNNTLTAQDSSGTINVTWNSQNAMSVYSNYTYLLPQASASVTVKLNITIGAKGFTNRSATLSGLTFSANNTYYSNISFSTTEGYIVGGVIWANGNLYKSNGQYLFYNSTEIYGGSGSCFICNSPEPYPTQTMPTSAWAAENDPCRKLTNAANKWRMPTLTEIQQLANSGFTTDVILNGVKGNKFGGVLFLPYSGYWPQSNIGHVESGERGLFWSTPGTAMIFSPGYNIVGYTGWNEFPQNGYTIRCVRNI